MLNTPGLPTGSSVAPRWDQSGGDAPGPAHAEFLGLPFSLLSQNEVIRLIVERSGAPYRYVVTPNAYHVVSAYEAPTRLLFEKCDYTATIKLIEQLYFTFLNSDFIDMV